jgi:hypothetical protein
MPATVTPRLGLRKPSLGQDPYFGDIDATLDRLDEGSDAVFVPCITGGGSGSANAALIGDVIADATPGDVLRFPTGRIGITPVVADKLVRGMGSGPWGTTFVCLGNSADAYWDWDLPAPAKGCQLSNLGFDLTASPLGTGVRIQPNAPWATLDHLNFEGGALTIASQAMNTRIEWVRAAEAAMFLHAIESGLELTLEHFIMERLTSGTTTKCIYIDAPGAGTIKGAVYGHDVRLAKLAGTVNVGLHAVAADDKAYTVPLFFSQLVLDNISGPAVKLNGIWRSAFDRGWFNGAAGTTSAVEIAGGGEMAFSDSQFFGGFGAAGCSYEFLGETAHFTSRGNKLRTGPCYKMPASGQPTDFDVDDDTFGGVLSNNMAKFYAAQALRGDVRPVAATPGVAGLAALASGTVTVPNVNADATSSQFNLTRRTLSGNPGHLFIAGVTTGVGFTISSCRDTGALETGDNSTVSWTMETFT